MKFKILNTQNKIESRIPTYIQYWYDRHTRSYIVQLLDQNKYELESEYSGNKQDRDSVIKYYSEEYNISSDKILT